MKYKTKNRTLLIEFLKNHSDNHYTVNQLKEELNEIPLATLYRLVDDLEFEGRVRKYIAGQNDPCCYQYVSDSHCQEHFHLICERCGKVIHLHCDEVNHLITHINQEHGFSINPAKTNFYGICEKCLGEINK